MNSIKPLKGNLTLIYSLAKNDFKTRYAGSYLGIIWAFIQPVVTVLIYWFVFDKGFKSAPVADFPFVLWLVAGIVPWFFYSESLLNATNCMIEYSYLVKKVVFNIDVLPLVKIVSTFFVHVFFIMVTCVLYYSFGRPLDIHAIQMLYYTTCTFFLSISICYATASIIIFFRDLGQLINILLQFGLWLTPIMWPDKMVGVSNLWILKLNPMYYIVEGYRDSLIRGIWFWEKPVQTAYFFACVIILSVISRSIYIKLKPHFADVL